MGDAAMEGLSARREAYDGEVEERKREEEERDKDFRYGAIKKDKWGVEHREIPGFGFTFDEESGYVVETHTKIKVGHTAQMPHNWTRVLKGDTFTNAVNRVVQDYRDDVEYLENILDVVYEF